MAGDNALGPGEDRPAERKPAKELPAIVKPLIYIVVGRVLVFQAL